ncbi:MAG: triphosphoribosyl-dephospho-CoA synthase [Clostridia bacterium]|nr:triphosphoribosyl-dephospho-CoA synthase [Clostridia bacterium]
MTAEYIASLVKKALIDEVEATPKPGLVDKEGNGAHKDMNITHFLKSAEVLEPFFEEMAQTAINAADPLLPPLREIGKRAEKAMFDATGGVNTHKGAIFSLGLLCSAAAYLQSRDPEKICAFCARLTADICKKEMGVKSDTHGQKAFLKTGASGARGEAENGFSSVRAYGLPVYESEIKKGANYAAVKTVVSLIANVRDTNVISRGGSEDEVREMAQTLLRDFSLDGARALDKEFIKRNVSPGGCADLLAATIFLYKLKTGK